MKNIFVYIVLYLLYTSFIHIVKCVRFFHCLSKKINPEIEE